MNFIPSLQMSCCELICKVYGEQQINEDTELKKNLPKVIFDSLTSYQEKKYRKAFVLIKSIHGEQYPYASFDSVSIDVTLAEIKKLAESKLGFEFKHLFLFGEKMEPNKTLAEHGFTSADLKPIRYL